MGAETGSAAEAPLGESLTRAMEVSASDGFRVWARVYDDAANPLPALEMRLLAQKIGVVPGMRILDAGCGTGRWMSWARGRGAEVFGIDACQEMLLKAERKTGLAGRSAKADICSIPLEDDAMDLALCSFTLGYVAPAGNALRELARVSKQVIVSDLHPEAVRAGWTRSFRNGDDRYELAHFNHSIRALDQHASAAGLTQVWRIEAPFGEPEREIFARGGKEDEFERASRVPAVLIASWQKQSD